VFWCSGLSDFTKRSSWIQVIRRGMKQALEDKGLSQKSFNLLITPFSSWQFLHEQHQLLIVHLFQLRRPVDEKHSTNLGTSGQESRD